MAAPNADQAKKLARKLSENFGDTEYWRVWNEERKLMAMRRALKAKFEQNPKLAEQLLATGSAYLIEDSRKDTYWGGAKPGSLNMLGNMLMERRYMMRKQRRAAALALSHANAEKKST